MRRALGLAALLLATGAAASDGETGVFGLGDPLEVGLVGGTYDTSTEGGASTTAIILGARLHAGAYTHRTILGMAGGVEGTFALGHSVTGSTSFWWGQVDGLANLGVLNLAAGPFVARLHLLAGFGLSLYSGGSFQGGARVALGLKDWVSVEASYLALPTVNLTLAHRASAALAILPIQLSLGAELNFGSAAAGVQHLSLVGTASWRPDFK